jgi:hypothetical protein
MKSKSESGLLILIIAMSIFIGVIAGVFVSNTITSKKVNTLESDLKKAEVKIKDLEEKSTTNSTNTTEENTTTDGKPAPSNQGDYSIHTLKNIYESFSDGDTQLVKAQKVAERVKTAIDDHDWYNLAKFVGSDADYFLNYGIYNYEFDRDNYEEINGKFIFRVTYDWDKAKLSSPKDVSLGNILTVEFEEGGRINITLFATGI